MIATLVLPDALRRQLADEAHAAFPRECCGLIEGEQRGDTAVAIVLHATRNLAQAHDRFEIDPVDHFRLLRALRGTGREIVGCYHSHPNGRAEPSARDAEGVGDEDFVWLIAALAEEDAPAAIDAFASSGGALVRLELARA